MFENNPYKDFLRQGLSILTLFFVIFLLIIFWYFYPKIVQKNISAETWKSYKNLEKNCTPSVKYRNLKDICPSDIETLNAGNFEKFFLKTLHYRLFPIFMSLIVIFIVFYFLPMRWEYLEIPKNSQNSV